MNDSSATRKDAWPSPPDPDGLFGRALLICGPVPPTGWAITRAPDRTAIYITPRGRDARAFVDRVVDFFWREVVKEHRARNWRFYHERKVAQKWKNDFMLWLWEIRDEG